MLGFRKLVVTAGLMVSAVAAQAVVFSNVIIQAAPLSNGSSFATIGNSISFFTPNAIVGDPVHPLRSGTLNMQYDAFSAAPMFANQMTINLGTALAGSGTILFQEQIFELDINGNEIGGPIGTTGLIVLTSSSPASWTGTISFSRQVERFRAKKAFTLSAPDTQAFDVAALQIVNQSVQTVPEPATMAAVGLGLALVARRRRKN